MNVDDYRKGFMDGMNVNMHEPAQIYIMGYSFDKIIELIQKDEEEKYNNRLSIKVIEAVRKSGYSGSIVLMELDRAGLKVVEK